MRVVVKVSTNDNSSVSRSDLIDVALQLKLRHDLLQRPALRQAVVPRLCAATAAAVFVG